MKTELDIARFTICIVGIVAALLFVFETMLVGHVNYLQENLDWSNDLRNGYEDFAYEKFNCIDPKPSDKQICLFRNINDLINKQNEHQKPY